MILKTDILKPEEIEVRMTIQMKLGEWTKLKEKLDDEYFGRLGEIREMIQKIVWQVERQMRVEEEEK